MVLCCLASCDIDLPFLSDDDDDEKEEVKADDDDDDEDEEDDNDDDDDNDKAASNDLSDYAYEDALKRIVKSKKGDFDAYWECYPEEVWDASDVDKDDMEDQFNESYEASVDYAGEVQDVEFDISDEEKLDDDDIAELIDEVNNANWCELDADNVSKAYEFEATIAIVYEEETGKATLDFYAIKYDGEWYLITEYYNFYA